MGQIRILPEILSNKIAAGEVVERPAAVVKELAENALDAQSTRIAIEIKNGGRSLIQVADNGVGMNRDDALLSLERYATSKIATDKDLFAIRSLGFRGEALPSIAAVSRFSLITRDADSDIGTQIDVTGGRIDKVMDIGAPVGTLIIVKQLFFNTPARRKFLKTVNTEMGHIADGVAGMAMGHPHVGFRLHHSGKQIKAWPAVTDPFDRIAGILGHDQKSRLIPVNTQTDRLHLSGWIGLPDIFRSTIRGIYLYVNGRLVRDRVIRHALLSAYSGRLMKGRYPLAVLSISVPIDEVDVNVHPTKHEVRFVRQQEVHNLVSQAVTAALKQRQQLSGRFGRPVTKPNTVAESPTVYEPAPLMEVSNKDFSPPSQPHSASPGTPSSAAPHLDRRKSFPAPDRNISKSFVSDESRPFRIIGQFNGTYIICESPEGLIVIDQHAAHERIKFEHLQKRYHQGKGSVQRLLLPETFELNFTEADILDRIRPDLNRLGLIVEPFGQNTFVIKTIPAILGGGEMAPLIREILDHYAETGQHPDFNKQIDECLILMACHGALRAHQTLTQKEQQALIDQLMACDNPAHCPHGRPTWIRWSLSDLEISFGRRP